MKPRGFVLFTRSVDNIWHSKVAAKLFNPIEIISAGFVTFKGGMPVCYGDSASLGIGSKTEDSEQLAIQLGISKV